MNPSGAVPPHPQTVRSATSRLLEAVAVLALLCLGLGVRLIDLTDAPLDFHGWRQLRSACIARSIYYQHLPSADPGIRDRAVALGRIHEQLEPNILETLVAYTYLLVGGEHLWIARLYAILFWLLGGWFLYLLGRRMVSGAAALVGLAYYLFLPFGVIGSRAFLPEPLMISWILIALYSLYEWSVLRSWKWAIVAGIASGLAILVKVFAVYLVACGAGALVLACWRPRRAFADPQVWLVFGLMAIIPSYYYIFGAGGHRAAGYLAGTVFSVWHLLLEPKQYALWLHFVDTLLFAPFVLAGTAAVLILPARQRAFSIGLWIGYAFLGLSLPLLIRTHSYYDLILVPVVGLSLVPLAGIFLSRLCQQSGLWRVLFCAIFLVAVAFPSATVYRTLMDHDYRLEAPTFRRIGEVLPEGRLIGLTHDYNNRLAYYGWRAIVQWPHATDMETLRAQGGSADPNDPQLREEFASRIQGYDFFVVTLWGELDAQPVLKSILYDSYPIYVQGDEYIVFDLRGQAEQ